MVVADGLDRASSHMVLLQGAMEPSEALAFTLAASKYDSSHQSKFASTHNSTIRSKNSRNTVGPKRSRMRVRLEWSGSGSRRP